MGAGSLPVHSGRAHPGCTPRLAHLSQSAPVPMAHMGWIRWTGSQAPGTGRGLGSGTGHLVFSLQALGHACVVLFPTPGSAFPTGSPDSSKRQWPGWGSLGAGECLAAGCGTTDLVLASGLSGAGGVGAGGVEAPVGLCRAERGPSPQGWPLAPSLCRSHLTCAGFFLRPGSAWGDPHPQDPATGLTPHSAGGICRGRGVPPAGPHSGPHAPALRLLRCGVGRWSSRGRSPGAGAGRPRTTLPSRRHGARQPLRPRHGLMGGTRPRSVLPERDPGRRVRVRAQQPRGAPAQVLAASGADGQAAALAELEEEVLGALAVAVHAAVAARVPEPAAAACGRGPGRRGARGSRGPRPPPPQRGPCPAPAPAGLLPRARPRAPRIW